jgi:hypothetical protein
VEKLPLLSKSSNRTASSSAVLGGGAAREAAGANGSKSVSTAGAVQLLREKPGVAAGPGDEVLSLSQSQSAKAATAAAGSGETALQVAASVPPHLQHSRFALCWWLLHQAAHYCVTSRLHTQFGGPSQSFGALEQLLQHMLAALKSNGSAAAADGRSGSSSDSARGQSLAQVQQQLNLAQQQQQQSGRQAQKTWRQQQAKNEQQQHDPHQKLRHQVLTDAEHCLPASDAAPLLLDFMLALESEVQAACEGSVTRQITSGPHLLFFAANARVSHAFGAASDWCRFGVCAAFCQV